MPHSGGGAATLSLRVLNRSTLQRQLLLERTPLPVPEAVTTVGGLQAQVPLVPYTALWSRLSGFEPEQLAGPLRDRRLVRTPLQRATVHLVTGADARRLRPLLQPVLERTFASTAWSRRLRDAEVDVPALVDVGRDLLARSPRTRADLRRILGQRFPGADPESAAIACTYLLPLVQTTPRGLWGESGQATWTTYDAWLGHDRAAEGDLAGLVLDYLSGFGPASVKDVQAWCGLTRLRAVADGLGDRLRRYRTDDGVELVDRADLSPADPDLPAPVRFLPEYDNAALGYADRRRIVPAVEHVWPDGGPGGAIGTVLVDGWVRATWALRREGAASRLDLHPSAALSVAERAAVEREGVALLGFLAAGSEHDLRWVTR